VLVVPGKFPVSHIDVAPVLLGECTQALAALRTGSDDPVIATTSETLCAILMLMICQVRGLAQSSFKSIDSKDISLDDYRTYYQSFGRGSPDNQITRTLIIVISLKLTCCMHFVELWQVPR